MIQKTLGKQGANFFLFFVGGGVYTYPNRCPFCNKVRRTKIQKIVRIVCVIIIVKLLIIAITIRLGAL